uniref:Uncharacterized protein n=1 Tax=Pyramimonas obovata TaxID=1411642 RepID=A0A7S0MV08_9CHLO|mmetsp:Transcript_14159/g.30267  ORF Transcript_14159/g.30267 Transcript_14159/m.30267 type:complete len:512 (+) Transcript_14159:99-1634(+)
MGKPKGSATWHGVVFPKDDKGERTTTKLGKKVWAAAAAAIEDNQAAIDAINKEKDWRHKYGTHVMDLAEKQMWSPEAAVKSAKAGLDCIHSEFEFIREGECRKLSEVMAAPKKADSFATVTIKGEGLFPNTANLVELPAEGDLPAVTGEKAVERVKEWVAQGVVEPDVATAFAEVVNKPDVMLRARTKVYVLLGATSEMCPLKALLALGCTVVAIQRPSPRVVKLIQAAKASPGTLILPAKPGTDTTGMADETLAQVAGADVLTQTPEIRDWLAQLLPEKDLVIGSYIYLDGEAHVRAAVAMDAIAASVCEARPATGLAYLASPATCYPIPKEACEDAAARHAAAPWWHGPTSLLFGGWAKATCPEVRGEAGVSHHMYNGLSVIQGPNYALAKTLQNWRCVVAVSEGRQVSANMAPASKTDSVMHVKAVARAMNGMETFEPLKPFEGATASSTMAVLLVHDMGVPQSAEKALRHRHPMQLFECGGVHGGLWRCPYTFDSLGTASYLFGLFK